MGINGDDTKKCSLIQYSLFDKLLHSCARDRVKVRTFLREAKQKKRNVHHFYPSNSQTSASFLHLHEIPRKGNNNTNWSTNLCEIRWTKYHTKTSKGV